MVGKALSENRLVVTFHGDDSHDFVYKKLKGAANDNAIYNSVMAINCVQCVIVKEINKVSTYTLFEM